MHTTTSSTSSFPVLLERNHRRGSSRWSDHDLHLATYEQGTTPDGDSIHSVVLLKGGVEDDTCATWTPLGQVAYIAQTSHFWSAGRLYVQAFPDGKPEHLMNEVKSVAFAPDRNEMAFIAWSADWERYVVSRASWDGSHARTVPPGKLMPAKVIYSPDGRSLVFSCEDENDLGEEIEDAPVGLHLMNLSNGRVRRLTAAYDGNPDFSPDGKTIVFRHYERGHDAIQALDVASGQVKDLQESGEQFLMHPAFTPDGSRIVFARQSRSSKSPAELCVMSSEGGPATVLMKRVSRAVPRILHQA